eukprot:scaffold55301_cov31-Attheya_sp.AAC.2
MMRILPGIRGSTIVCRTVGNGVVFSGIFHDRNHTDKSLSYVDDRRAMPKLLTNIFGIQGDSK